MMTQNANISALAVVPGKFIYSKEGFISAGRSWLREDTTEFHLFSRYVENSQIKQRAFALPIEEILRLQGQKQRTNYFEEIGTALALEATNNALLESGMSASEVKTIITTSCSCPLIPALDTIIIEQLFLSKNIRRIPIYQHGCGAGVIGIALASTLAADGPVILTSTELCSLVYHKNDLNRAHLVGSAIFGDGAGSVVIMKNQLSGLSVIDSFSYLLPETRHLMGYNIEDDGHHLRLDRALPEHLMQQIPSIVDNFLSSHQLSRKDIPWWLFHPGGTKILAALEDTFKLSSEQCHWSRDILSEVGNMSSATILFVIKKFIDDQVMRAGERALVIGIGPGLTIELILLGRR